MRAISRIIMCFGALALATAAAHGGELNPAAVAFKLPDQIDWKSPSANAGVQQSILVGDPAKDNKMDFAGMMAGYKQFFATAEQPNKPSRSAVQVVALAAPGALVEIEVVAAKAH